MLRFDCFQILAGFHVLKLLYDPRRPANFNQSCSGIFAQSGEHAFIAGRKVAHGGIYGKVLRQAGSRNDFDPRSDTIAVGLGAHRLDSDPIIAISAIIPQHISFLSEIADDYIDIAVVIDITKGCTATCPVPLKNISSKHSREMPKPVAEQ